MKELADFTVERLQRIIRNADGVTSPTYFEVSPADIAALARIALAAKTAEPSHYVVTKEYTDSYGPDVERSVYVTELEASKHKADHGGEVTALYATPVLNSPELPDGWIKCSDELPPEGYEEDGGSVSVLVWYKDKPDCGHPYGISNVFFVRKHWEKWYTHWQPLPAPPTTEK